MLRLDINLLFTVLNILIWFFLIRRFLFKPVNAIIRKREALIAEQYAEAKQLQEEASTEKDKCIHLQTQIENERTATVIAAKEAARAEYDRIVTEAEAKAEEILKKTRKEAELEKSRIVGKAEREIRSIIMDTAAQLMGSSGSERMLYDQFLTKAGEAHAE